MAGAPAATPQVLPCVDKPFTVLPVRLLPLRQPLLHPGPCPCRRSELFRYNGGEEWGVGHYLFEKR